MKITPLHALAILLLLVTVSCSKHSDTPPPIGGDPPPQFLKLSRTDLTLGIKAGATDTFQIMSTVPWTISLSDGAEKWLSANTLKGERGTTTVRLTATSNNISKVPHRVTVTVTTDDNRLDRSIELQVDLKIYTTIWQKSFGGSGYDFCNWLLQTADGGYIAAGGTSSNDGDVSGNHGDTDAWVFKTDRDGKLLWQHPMGGSATDLAIAMVSSTDGGIVFAGYTYSKDGDVATNHGNADFWVVKLNAVGNIVWERSFGGSGEDMATSIINTPDGGYLVAGQTSSQDGEITGNHGGSDLWVVKLDAGGNKVWAKTFGGSKNELIGSITQSQDGGYLLTGGSESSNGDAIGNHGGFDILVLKLDANGNKRWSKMVGGPLYDISEAIISNSDGSMTICGSTSGGGGDALGNGPGNERFWVIKLDNNSNLLWQTSGQFSPSDRAYSLIAKADGGYLVSGDGNFLITLDDNGKLVGWEVFTDLHAIYSSWLITSTDNTYVCGGAIYNPRAPIFHENYDAWLIKFQ